MADHDVISHAELCARVHYDPETGKFSWIVNHSSKAKTGQELGSWDLYGYKTVRIYKRSYKLHRLAWFYMTGEWPRGDVDHINGIRHDNRWVNLRDVSRKANLENSMRNGSHKKSDLPRGVGNANGGKFSAHISHNNRTVYLGAYLTPEEAGAAYMAAKRLLHAGHVSEDRLEALAA
jgi:hypothetical protein